MRSSRSMLNLEDCYDSTHKHTHTKIGIHSRTICRNTLANANKAMKSAGKKKTTRKTHFAICDLDRTDLGHCILGQLWRIDIMSINTRITFYE